MDPIHPILPQSPGIPQIKPAPGVPRVGDRERQAAADRDRRRRQRERGSEDHGENADLEPGQGSDEGDDDGRPHIDISV